MKKEIQQQKEEQYRYHGRCGWFKEGGHFLVWRGRKNLMGGGKGAHP